MKPTYLVLVLVVVVAALGALGVPDAVRRATAQLAGEDQACPPPEARFALAPVAEERKEPTLAQPEPAKERLSGQIVVVRVEGEVPGLGCQERAAWVNTGTEAPNPS